MMIKLKSIAGRSCLTAHGRMISETVYDDTRSRTRTTLQNDLFRRIASLDSLPSSLTRDASSCLPSSFCLCIRCRATIKRIMSSAISYRTPRCVMWARAGVMADFGILITAGHMCSISSPPSTAAAAAAVAAAAAAELVCLFFRRGAVLVLPGCS